MKLTSYILAAIVFYLVLRWDVFDDYIKWKEGRAVKHFKEAIIRGVLVLPSAVLLYWPKYITCESWRSYVFYAAIVIGLIGAVWWEFFDGWYNKKRGYRWRFNGSVDKDDSWFDKFLYGIGDVAEGILKISLILLFLALYIFL